MKDSLQIATTKIIQLQSQVDSIKNAQAMQELKYKAIEHQEVVNQVNEFYDSAWIKLLLFVGTIGIVAPIIIQWMQQRNFKSLSDSLLGQLKSEFELNLKELENNNTSRINVLDKKFEIQSEKLKNDNQQSVSRLEANLFATNSSLYDNLEAKDLSCVFSMLAAQLNDELGDHRVALTNLEDAIACFKTLDEDSRKDVDKYVSDWKSGHNFKKYISLFKKSKHYEVYKEAINRYEVEIENKQSS